MRHRGTFVATCVALMGSFVAAALVAPASAQRDERTTESTPAPPVVELVDPGQEPLVPLRYTVTAGTTTQALQTVDQKIQQVDDEGFGRTDRLPTIEFGISVTVDEVLPDASFRTSLGFTGVFATSDGSALGQQQARQIEAMLAPLRNLTGASTTSDRGVVLSASYDIPDDLPSQVSTVLEQLETQLTQLTPPFPEEPVGVGARWRVTTQLELGGIEAEQHYEYRVVSMSGPEVEIDVKLRQTAKRQPFDPPGAPEGARYRLLRFRNRGEGTLRIDLTKPLPVDSEMSGHLVQRFRVTHDGETETYRVTIDQEQGLRETTF